MSLKELLIFETEPEISIQSLLGFDSSNIASELNENLFLDSKKIYFPSSQGIESKLSMNDFSPDLLILSKSNSQFSEISDSWGIVVEYSYKTKKKQATISNPFIYSPKKQIVDKLLKSVNDGFADYSLVYFEQRNDVPKPFREGYFLKISLHDKQKTSISINITSNKSLIDFAMNAKRPFSLFGWASSYFNNLAFVFNEEKKVSLESTSNINNYLAKKYESFNKIMLAGSDLALDIVDIIPSLNINHVSKLSYKLN